MTQLDIPGKIFCYQQAESRALLSLTWGYLTIRVVGLNSNILLQVGLFQFFWKKNICWTSIQLAENGYILEVYRLPSMIDQSQLIQYVHPFGVTHFPASNLDKLFLRHDISKTKRMKSSRKRKAKKFLFYKAFKFNLVILSSLRGPKISNSISNDQATLAGCLLQQRFWILVLYLSISTLILHGTHKKQPEMKKQTRNKESMSISCRST